MFETLTNCHQRAFLSAFVCCGRVKASAKAAQIDRCNHYEWLDTDPIYAGAFQLAQKMAGDVFEDEATRRAVVGVTEPYVHKGEIVTEKVALADGTETSRPILKRKYSDRLLAMLLQGAKPEKYSKKIEHSGEVTLNLAERLAAGRARVAKPVLPTALPEPHTLPQSDPE